RDRAGDLRIGNVACIAEELAGLEVPILGEHRLQLQRDRTDEPDVEFLVVEPRLEGRIDEIRRAGVTDATIDDRDLAVVAQIEPSGAAEETDPHRLFGQYSRRLE